MTSLMQTYFAIRLSFTFVAEDIMNVLNDIEWEKGDYNFHVPTRPYERVFYIGSFMNQDIARFYRYIWWTDRHIYYGVTEGPPVLSPFNMGALQYMKVVVPSEYVRSELQNAGIRVDGVVPHGVRLDEIRSADPRPWRKIFGEKTVVLYVAHRNIRKGFKELVKAWKLTRASRDPDVLLVLHTSRTPNVNDSGYIIPEEGNIVVTDNILKLDRSSLYGLYRACDVYVHGALAEGFGIPVLEAMAAGKPVLVIDAPPMNELTNDMTVKVEKEFIYNDRGVVTYRLRIPDLMDYAEKLDQLVYDAHLREELGARNAEKAEDYDIAKVYPRLRRFL